MSVDPEVVCRRGVVMFGVRLLKQRILRVFSSILILQLSFPVSADINHELSSGSGFRDSGSGVVSVRPVSGSSAQLRRFAEPTSANEGEQGVPDSIIKLVEAINKTESALLDALSKATT